jgi:hypothetical protein
MNGLAHIDRSRHPIDDASYASTLRSQLDRDGLTVLRGFLSDDAVAAVLDESLRREHEAFFTTDTHNVYLTPPDAALGDTHIFNRRISSSKGCLADDQVGSHSPLRAVYTDTAFTGFLCDLLGVAELHPYADTVSSINVHFHRDGQELGWHFDNSEFAVTLLIRAPEAGGVFEYVPDVRDAEAGELAFDRVEDVVDGRIDAQTLDIHAGDLVVFRGRNSMHRVTPTTGPTTRVLVVFAYNTEPAIALSESARKTFYGRLS